MTRSACLIFNPVAGQGNPDQDLQQIQTLLSSEIDLDIQLTTEEIDANQLAQEAVERGFDMIIASGGDGTLSAAAEALINQKIPLGIIARGTANAFASALGIPDTIEEACQAILSGTTRVIDVAQCNGRPMVLLTGVGFEAETIEGASRQAKDRLGMLAYLLSGLQQLSEFKSFEAEIETEDKIITVTAAAITIANVAPSTSVLAQGPAGVVFDDGLLDVTVVAPANPVGAVAASYHLLQTALRSEAVERNDIGYLRAKQIKVKTQPPQKVVLDGEIIGTTPIEIECIPGGLTICIPAVQTIQPSEKLEGLPNLKVELKSENAESVDA